MKTVGCFSEMKCFADDGSIKKFIVEKIDYDKIKVIEYLKSHKKVASCPKEAIDCISGKVIQPSFTVYTDDEYTWCDFLVYHIQKYNISLPKDFLDKINSNK